MNKIDNFFKEKLSDHSIAPGNDAWARVESGRSKKNSKAIWLRIAAALLICSAGISVWMATQKDQVGHRQLTSTDAKQIPEAMDKGATENQVDVSEKNNEQVAEAATKKNTAITKGKEQKANHLPLAGTVNKNEAEEENNIARIETVTLIAQEEAVNDIPTLSNEVKESVEKPIVIEYTLATVSDPSNELENEVIVKKTGFKKVLEIAGEVRSGEGGLGGLRQAKNEILAFNFIKDKEDRNNK